MRYDEQFLVTMILFALVFLTGVLVAGLLKDHED